jgi:hypothetical protein
MGQVKQPRIWSSVPKGQKVATLDLETSPSSVLLYKKSKNCAKRKKKAPNSPPLSLPQNKAKKYNHNSPPLNLPARKKSIKVPKNPDLRTPSVPKLKKQSAKKERLKSNLTTSFRL